MYKNTRNSRALTLRHPRRHLRGHSSRHGKENVPTDFSDATAYGASYKSYIPGLRDYKSNPDAVVRHRRRDGREDEPVQDQRVFHVSTPISRTA